MKKSKKEVLDLIIKDIRRKFEKIYYINIQNFSVNGSAQYNGEKCFFKIVNEELFIKELNGYLISHKEIPTAKMLFIKQLFNSNKYLLAYAYDSSKSALEMLTKELGIELANKNITINALSFGAVETKMNEVWESDISKKEEARKKVPLKIIFKPSQIATFAYKIVENFSEYTTGSIFIVDGGRSLV